MTRGDGALLRWAPNPGGPPAGLAQHRLEARHDVRAQEQERASANCSHAPAHHRRAATDLGATWLPGVRPCIPVISPPALQQPGRHGRQSTRESTHHRLPASRDQKFPRPRLAPSLGEQDGHVGVRSVHIDEIGRLDDAADGAALRQRQHGAFGGSDREAGMNIVRTPNVNIAATALPRFCPEIWAVPRRVLVFPVIFGHH